MHNVSLEHIQKERIDWLRYFPCLIIIYMLVTKSDSYLSEHNPHSARSLPTHFAHESPGQLESIIQEYHKCIICAQ